MRHLIMPETAQQAVDNGSRALDLKRPNWFNEIDVDSLNMASGGSCIVGQLWGWYPNHKFTVAKVLDPEHARDYREPRGDETGKYIFEVHERLNTLMRFFGFTIHTRPSRTSIGLSRAVSGIAYDYDDLDNAWEHAILARRALTPAE